MKLGKYPINRNDSKRIKSLKRKLKHVESSIVSCWLRGFGTKKLMNARSYYIEQIKLISKQVKTMAKKYYCDHCDQEIHFSKKISITPNENGSFNIMQGDLLHQGDNITMRNFMRLDYCNIDCMVKGITNGKYKAVINEKTKVCEYSQP